MSHSTSVVPLADLILDENVLLDLILSTNVHVPVTMMPLAKLLTADILLATVFAQDMPPGSDIAGAMVVLSSASDPRIRVYLPELRDALLRDLVPEDISDPERRWEFIRHFFSESSVFAE